VYYQLFGRNGNKEGFTTPAPYIFFLCVLMTELDKEGEHLLTGVFSTEIEG
jgi:hypothetical protein